MLWVWCWRLCKRILDAAIQPYRCEPGSVAVIDKPRTPTISSRCSLRITLAFAAFLDNFFLLQCVWRTYMHLLESNA